MGKQMQRYQGTSGTYVDRLPNLPYFVAGGQQIAMGKEGSDAIARSLDQLFAAEPFSKVPEESRVRIKKMVVELQGEVPHLLPEAESIPIARIWPLRSSRGRIVFQGAVSLSR